MKPIQKAAVIHDMCSVGKAAMTNILPVLSVMGIEVCPIVTMLLSTHTGGYSRPVMRSQISFIKESAKHFRENEVDFEYILVGYLGNEELTEEVIGFIKEFPKAQVVLDPIMGDHGKFYSNFNESYCNNIKKLLPVSQVLTPNYTESCFLADEPYEQECTIGKLERIVEKLKKRGCRKLVITSVPIQGYTQSIYICEEESRQLLKKQSRGNSYHGTGDIFTAVLLGKMAIGHSLTKATLFAHEFTSECIAYSDRFAYEEREGVMLEHMLGKLLK